METLSRSPSSTEGALFFELMYLESRYLADFLLTLDLLRQIRSGIFAAIFLIPSASTWSRLRSSATSGQPQLRTRAFPLGVPGSDPQVAELLRQDNRILEAISWCAEQALACSSTRVGLNLVFPEDPGGHPVTGPSSIWALREFQLLEGVHDVHRAAGYLCQITGSEYKRPMGLLSTCQDFGTWFTQGWPRLVSSEDRLVYKGPLPVNCGCGRTHPPPQGFDGNGDFTSAQAHTLGTSFWLACCSLSLHTGQSLPLRDGAVSLQCVPGAVGQGGNTSYPSVSLASSADSWRSQYDAWQTGTLERTELAGFTSSSATPLTSAWRTLSNTRSSNALVRSGSQSPTFAGASSSSCYALPTAVDTAHLDSRQVSSSTRGSLKRPLISLRPRGDGGADLLTGVRRRVECARCVGSLSEGCSLIACVVCL